MQAYNGIMCEFFETSFDFSLCYLHVYRNDLGPQMEYFNAFIGMGTFCVVADTSCRAIVCVCLHPYVSLTHTLCLFYHN